MPSKCNFEFDRTNTVYYTGETIKGHVSLNTTSEKPVKNVYIRFAGRGKVEWSNGNSTHSDVEDYVDIRTYMREEGILFIGSYNFKFSIPIPENCPSSCYKKHGKIHYEVSLVINRHQVYNNKFSQPVTVLHIYDLNFQPELWLPIKEEQIKYFCCWWCRKPQIIFTVTIPYGGYAPGQNIVYTLDINNLSRNSDKYKYFINVRLRELSLCTANWSNKNSKKTLAAMEHNLTQTTERTQKVSSSLFIPPVPPTSRGQQNIMISYFIIMTIICSPHTIVDISIPIVMGTKPIVLNKSRKSSDSIRPTYEQYVISLDTDDFTPKYPMYRNI